MSFYQSKTASDKAIEEYKQAVATNDPKTQDKFRKIAPFIEHHNEFIYFFILLALSGGMNPTNPEDQG